MKQQRTHPDIYQLRVVLRDISLRRFTAQLSRYGLALGKLRLGKKKSPLVVGVDKMFRRFRLSLNILAHLLQGFSISALFLSLGPISDPITPHSERFYGRRLKKLSKSEVSGADFT